jgi:hypothetical protein
MARFFSNYQISKKDKQLNEEMLLNTHNYKTELKNAINFENHRINIDSAKKRAVIQHMDYDGFHQMVLGADLKGVKLGELTQLKPENTIMNSVMIHRHLTQAQDMFKNNFIPDEGDINTTNTNTNINTTEILSDIINNNSPSYEYESLSLSIFKKKWKSYTITQDKINCLLEIYPENKYFEYALDNDILDADLFSELIYQIGSYISTQDISSKDRSILLLNYIRAIINNKQFTTLKKFLGKKQKQVYITVLENKLSILGDDENNLLGFVVEKLF